MHYLFECTTLTDQFQIAIHAQHEILIFLYFQPSREMQLKVGQTAAALIKATEVMILRV